MITIFDDIFFRCRCRPFFLRPGSLKAVAQVLFAPEQAKQAMAERKTEVFGQFATLHPEAEMGWEPWRAGKAGSKAGGWGWGWGNFWVA